MNNYQRGSVKIFTITAIVLVAIALAVLYGVRQFTLSQRTAPISDEVTTTSQEAANQSVDQAGTTANNETTTTNTGETKSEETSTKDDTKSDTTTVATTETETATTAGTSDGSTVDDALPQTGPADSFLPVLSLGVVVAVAVAYNRSRQLI